MLLLVYLPFVFELWYYILPQVPGLSNLRFLLLKQCKQCCIWAPYYRAGFESNQILVTPTSFVSQLNQHVLLSRHHCRAKRLWLGWCLWLSFGSSKMSVSKRLVYIGTSSSSPFSMNSLGVVFGNMALPSICESNQKLPHSWLPYSKACVVCVIQWDPLANTLLYATQCQYWKLHLVTKSRIFIL